MYFVISLLVLRAGCGIWLYQFLTISYLFTFRPEPLLSLWPDPLAWNQRRQQSCQTWLGWQQKHRLRTVSNKLLGGLNLFAVAATLALGSAAVHKHTFKVVWSVWRTSTHQCVKAANIQIKIQHWDATRWVLNSKNNTKTLEQQKPNSWTLVVPTKALASSSNRLKWRFLVAYEFNWVDF